MFTNYYAVYCYHNKRSYVGTRQAGSYQNNKGVRVTAPFELRMFYITKETIGTNNIPISYNHNRLRNNTKVQEYSLCFFDHEGLVD